MSEVIVNLQLNVTDEAGDWADPRRSTTASGTGWLLSDTARMLGESFDLVVRINAMRGAVEALKALPNDRGIGHNHTAATRIGYGEPAAYSSMHFVTRPIS